eukprot:364585-Chlamydomonas_euryale.AAC.4
MQLEYLPQCFPTNAIVSFGKVHKFNCKGWCHLIRRRGSLVTRCCIQQRPHCKHGISAQCNKRAAHASPITNKKEADPPVRHCGVSGAFALVQWGNHSRFPLCGCNARLPCKAYDLEQPLGYRQAGL